MAVNFPSNPTNGQTITVSGITYAYDSTQGVWSDSPQGLTQAIDALTDVDTSTSAPTNGQILQWNSTDSEWQPADSSAGVTVYATIDDLPLTGVTEGSMALVDSTDKLYIFSDTGWYSISIVNQTPSISGVSATYALATDGTATTVTVTATDPEGVPLTYSIVSDTSGNIATVSQGTGSNTNQWTITPSTNTANAGSFTLVFRASDGTNVASASSTFTLVFSIENSNYTTALITSVGANNAVNNSFDDASTNNHTITANGNVTQNTFSPYRHGGYSTYFNTAASYLRTPSDSRYDIGGTGDWSFEAWVYVPESHTLDQYARCFGLGPSYATSKSFGLILSDLGNSNKITAYWVDTSNSLGRKIVSTTSFDKGQWNHLVLCRNSNDIAIFYNGTRIAHDANYSASIDTGNTYLWLGSTGAYSSSTGDEGFVGYIRDAHFVNGSHNYDASSASLTLPTEELSTTTNTKFLGAQEPYLNDNSTHDVSLTVSGTVKTEPFSPYDHNGYSASSNGGSIYFDGSGDYLSITHDSSLKPSTSGAFSVELWYYPTAHPSGNPAQITGDLGVTSYPSNCHGFDITHSTSGDLSVRWGAPSYQDGSSGDGGAITNNTLILNTWNHIVFCRNSESTATMALFLNGKRCWYESGSQVSIADATASNFYVGYAGSASGTTFLPVTGAISNFKFRKGATSYDPTSATYTVPITTPAVSDTETSLLLNGTDAGIIDKSQSVKTVLLNGGAKSSTTQTKYLTSSMYFDGNAYIKSDAGAELYGYTGAFTIEAWIYPTSISQYANPIFNYGNSGSTGNDHFNFELGGGGILQVRWNQAYPVSASQASSTPLNTWTHVALTRDSSNNLKLWVGGTLADSATQSGGLPTAGANRTFIGSQSYSEGTASRSFNGYISDLRVTKGLARYTSNFTAPTAALEG